MAFLPNKVSFRVPVLDGGLNTKWTDISCPPHMSPDLQNVDFADVGAVKSAKGYQKVNSVAISSGPIDGLHNVYVSAENEEYLVAIASGTVYHTTTDTFTPVTGGTGIFTAGVDVCCQTVEDEVYMTDGYVPAHRLVPGAAAEVKSVGIAAITGTATANAGVGGSMTTGYRNWAIAGLNENGTESNYTQIVTDAWVNSTVGSMALTGIPTYPASAGVVTKYLYRSTAGASAPMYRVTALTAGQTTYTDVAADGSISIAPKTDNNPPPYCQFWWYHRGRMFAAGDPSYPQRVWYSSSGYPEIWPALNFLDVGKGDGLPITGLRVMGNSVCVHKTSHDGASASLWLIYMPDSTDVTTSTNWYIIKSPSAYASMTNKGIAFFENLLAFLDKHGLFAWTGEQIAPGPASAQSGQYLSMSRSTDIEPNIGDFRTSLLHKAALFNFEDKLWLAVPSTGESTANDGLLTYDYSVTTKERGQGAWSKLSGPGLNNFATYDGKLVGGSATTGTVYELDTVWNSDGGNTNSYFYTIAFAGNEKHWDNVKIWRYLWLTVDTPGSWNLTVTWWADKSASQTGTETVNLSGGGAEWDIGTWDASMWDSGIGRKTKRINLHGCVGKTIQFKFSTNSKDVWWAIYKLELEYNLRSRRD